VGKLTYNIFYGTGFYPAKKRRDAESANLNPFSNALEHCNAAYLSAEMLFMQAELQSVRTHDKCCGKMREISPAENVSTDDFFNILDAEVKGIVAKIRDEKKANSRPVPSPKLIDKSNVLSADKRQKLIDKVGLLVDENLCGRSEMCIQFAILLTKSLEYLNISASTVMGTAMYFNNGKEIFRWSHAWVRTDAEVIDANVDILFENPKVPKTVAVLPYWGPVASIPSDRRLREDRNIAVPKDNDIESIWWPDLKSYIDSELNK
jgi:hypothetical protein